MHEVGCMSWFLNEASTLRQRVQDLKITPLGGVWVVISGVLSRISILINHFK